MTENKPGNPDFLERKSGLLRLLAMLELWSSVVFLSGLIILVVLQVFTRFVLNNPLVWTEELARFVFIWFVFCAAAFVTGRRKNITVILYGAKRIGPRAISIIETFAHVLIITASVFMIFGGVQLMARTAGVVWPATQIPVSFVYLIPLISFILIAFHSLLNAYLSVRYWEQFEDEADDITKMGV